LREDRDLIVERAVFEVEDGLGGHFVAMHDLRGIAGSHHVAIAGTQLKKAVDGALRRADDDGVCLGAGLRGAA
jgi:hypothetical protein